MVVNTAKKTVATCKGKKTKASSTATGGDDALVEVVSATASSSTPLPSSCPTAKVNSAYHVAVQGRMQAILSHLILSVCKSADPLTVAEGAKMEPFDDAKFKLCLGFRSVSELIVLLCVTH